MKLSMMGGGSRGKPWGLATSPHKPSCEIKAAARELSSQRKKKEQIG